MSIFKKVFTGEVFFALFLLSGVFKESLNLPVDLAAVFLILTAWSIAYRFIKNPEINKYNMLPVTIFLLFIILVLISFFYTLNVELSQDKIIKLILLTTPAVIVPFFLFKNKETLTRFLIAIAFVSTILSTFSLPMIFQRGAEIGFVGFNEGNYQGLARTGGIGIVILIFLGLLNNEFKKYRIILVVSIVVVSISLLASGSRAPIVAVIVALLITIISSVKVKNGEIKYPKYYNKIIGLFIILFIPLIWAYNQGYFNSILFRFEILLNSSGGGASILGRTERFNSAIEMWNKSPILGNGFGSFGDVYSNGFYDYPHNLILEILSELGLLGLFMFVALLLVAFERFYRLSKIKMIRNHNIFMTVLLGFLVTFINAMVSGDINSNRMMLTFVSILCLLPLVFKKEFLENKS